MAAGVSLDAGHCHNATNATETGHQGRFRNNATIHLVTTHYDGLKECGAISLGIHTAVSVTTGVMCHLSLQPYLVLIRTSIRSTYNTSSRTRFIKESPIGSFDEHVCRC